MSPSSRSAAPGPPALASRRTPLWLATLMGGALVWWVSFSWRTGLTLEDAFITYRYAENLALGRGFVFNPGERVLGTTTPLFAGMLAAAGGVFGVAQIPLASKGLGILFGQLAGFATFGALRSVGISVVTALVATGVVLLHPDVTAATVGGMETPLVLALMAASLYALCTRRERSAAALCALLVLTRIDGLVWSALVLGLAAWRRPASLPASAGVFLATLAPWLLFAFAYFGSPIPQSVVAKGVIGNLHASKETLSALGYYAHWFLAASGATPGRGTAPTFAIVATFVLAGLGGTALLRQPRLQLLNPLVLLPLALFAAYLVGRAPTYFPWYLVPPLWCVLVLAVLGAERALRGLQGGRVRRALLAGVLGGLAGVQLVAGNADELEHRIRQQRYEDGLRRRVGEWLAENTPPDARVAMEAVGYQAYFSKRHVIDLGGIVTPEVVAIFDEVGGHPGKAMQQVFERFQPDYLVLRSFEVDRNLAFHGEAFFPTPADRNRFFETYRYLRRFHEPDPPYLGGLGRLTVYQRRDAKP